MHQTIVDLSGPSTKKALYSSTAPLPARHAKTLSGKKRRKKVNWKEVKHYII